MTTPSVMSIEKQLRRIWEMDLKLWFKRYYFLLCNVITFIISWDVAQHSSGTRTIRRDIQLWQIFKWLCPFVEKLNEKRQMCDAADKVPWHISSTIIIQLIPYEQRHAWNIICKFCPPNNYFITGYVWATLE